MHFLVKTYIEIIWGNNLWNYRRKIKCHFKIRLETPKHSQISAELSSLSPIFFNIIRLFKSIKNWDLSTTNKRGLSNHEFHMTDNRQPLYYWERSNQSKACSTWRKKLKGILSFSNSHWLQILFEVSDRMQHVAVVWEQ